MITAKPLQWRKPTDHPQDREGSLWIANGIGGRYSIEKESGEFILWWAHDEFIWEACASVAEAKAKAEADWQAKFAAIAALSAATALSQAEGAQKPVAIVVYAHGDPEAFGEREIEVLADLSKIPYNTKLFALPTRPREQEGAEPVASVDMLTAAYNAGWQASGEGWNCEYPGDAEKSQYWNEKRAASLLAIQNGSIAAHPLPAASFQAGAEGWNYDMDAAPKDGTEILAWRSDQGVFVCRHANMEEFVAKDQHGDPIEEYDDSYENWWHDRWGWLESELAPTAWMPLPAEPLPIPASSEER